MIYSTAYNKTYDTTHNMAYNVTRSLSMASSSDMKDSNANVRQELLDEAASIVTKDRNKQYGTPESTFGTIARLWSAYLDIELTGADTAAMMILMKTARLKKNKLSRDSWVDVAGYAACGWSSASYDER